MAASSKKNIRIKHAPSATILAEGPLGWGITSFEGAYYVRGKYLKSDGFKANFLPGLCFYKFLYVWLNFTAPDGTVTRNLGWKYWLPNPLFPFIWYRVAIPKYHPDISFEMI
jgi:uncharacterized protein (DUF427 family)